jgi:hypothetical protein
VWFSPAPKDLALLRTSSPLCPVRESRLCGSCSARVLVSAKWREQLLSKLWRRMAGGIRLTRRHPNRAQAIYRVEVLANSTLGHCGQRALTVPRTWMIAPSVITPRNANKLKKAKQLSGTASASNKSRFLAKYVCLQLRLRRPAEF